MVKLHLPRKPRPLLQSGWKRCLTGWFVLKIPAGTEKYRLTMKICFPVWPVHWNPWDISHTRPRAQVSTSTISTCLLKKAVRGSEDVMSKQLKIHTHPNSHLILAHYRIALKRKKITRRWLQSSLYVLSYTELPLDKIVKRNRGENTSSGNQGFGKLELSALKTE